MALDTISITTVDRRWKTDHPRLCGRRQCGGGHNGGLCKARQQNPKVDLGLDGYGVRERERAEGEREREPRGRERVVRERERVVFKRERKFFVFGQIHLKS